MKHSRALGFSLEKKKSFSLLKNSETRVDLSVKSDEVPQQKKIMKKCVHYGFTAFTQTVSVFKSKI